MTQPGPSSAPAPFARAVIATDLSARGDRVLARAAWLPLSEGSRLTIVHVVPARADVDPSRRTEVARQVAELRQRLQARRVAARVDSVILVGTPHEALLALAVERGAELVMIGAHGQRPVRDFLGLGTTADRVVRTADLPVLVVKRPARGRYARLLLALDLPPSAATVRAAEIAWRIVPRPRRVAAVHAVQLPSESKVRTGGAGASAIHQLRAEQDTQARMALQAWLAANAPVPGHVQTIVRNGDPRGAVVGAIEQGFDLVTLGTHGRSIVARWFMGSVAETVLREAPCDVLVARAPVM